MTIILVWIIHIEVVWLYQSLIDLLYVAIFIVKWALDHMEWFYEGWISKGKHEPRSEVQYFLPRSRGAICITPRDLLLFLFVTGSNFDGLWPLFCDGWLLSGFKWMNRFLFNHLGWRHIIDNLSKFIYKKITCFHLIVIWETFVHTINFCSLTRKFCSISLKCFI